MFCVFIIRKKRSIRSRFGFEPRDTAIPPDLSTFILSRGNFNPQMGAYDIEDALTWKKKIELVIDQV
jgi:hypothetical protein